MKFLKSLPKERLQKVILAAIGSLIGVGAISNFYIAEQFHNLSEQRQRATKLAAQVETEVANQKSEASNTALRDKLTVFVDSQRQKMVSGDLFSWVVRELTLVAEKHPLHVSSMRPGAKANNLAKPRYEMFLTHIEADGTYNQVGEFLRDLENTFPTGEVRSLDLMSTDSKRGQCRVTFDLALLVKPDEPTAAPKERKPSS